MPTIVPPSGIRSLRLAAGLSIRQLEQRTGINRGRLSIIERGVPPTEDEAVVILAALRQGADERTALTP